MIGDKLRAEREKQGLTIKDIEKGTSIRALYIEAIEKGEYQTLPGEVYAKGFIRNYATFLKLNADDVVRAYTEENHPEEIAAKAAAQAAEEETKQQNKGYATSESASQNPRAFATGADFRQRVESSHKKQNTMLLVVVLLVVLGGAAYLFLSDGDDAKTAKQPVAAQTAKAPVKKEAAPTPEKKVDGVELVAKFNDRCWTQVDVDGKTVYEGTMEKGATETWKGKEKVVITAGNAGAVELTLNGKSLGKGGAEGEVIEKTYGPEGEVAPKADAKADRTDGDKADDKAKNAKKDSKN